MLAATVATIMLSAGIAAPAYASDGSGSSADDIVLAVVNGSGVHPIDILALPEVSEARPTPASDPTSPLTPTLIDFPQWVSCFRLNNAQSDPYASYTVYKDGRAYDFNIRCGEYNPSAQKGWGYKKIHGKQERDWQKLLENAKASGWDPTSQGVDGWDDLMASAVGGATAFWGYSSIRTGDNTGCVNSNVTWWNVKTQKVAYKARVVVVFATDSDRIISAYPVPNTKTDC